MERAPQSEEDRLDLVMRTISEPTRFKIVQLLLNRHHCSRSIALTLGISESAVSQHMTALKQAGAVTWFRHGYHVHYVLNPDALRLIERAMNEWLERIDHIADCHELNPCAFVIEDGTQRGCLYRSQPPADGTD